MLSIFILQARISKLSHVTEVSYNCCPNTCCCFTGTYAGLNSCPFCKHTWYNSEGYSYKKYKYLPIEPCIKSLYLMDHYAEVLCYCSLPRDSKIEDVFNGDRKSTRLNSSHQIISYAVFCLKKKKKLK